jgi:hypothetical protein
MTLNIKATFVFNFSGRSPFTVPLTVNNSDLEELAVSKNLYRPLYRVRSAVGKKETNEFEKL